MSENLIKAEEFIAERGQHPQACRVQEGGSASSRKAPPPSKQLRPAARRRPSHTPREPPRMTGAETARELTDPPQHCRCRAGSPPPPRGPRSAHQAAAVRLLQVTARWAGVSALLRGSRPGKGWRGAGRSGVQRPPCAATHLSTCQSSGTSRVGLQPPPLLAGRHRGQGGRLPACRCGHVPEAAPALRGRGDECRGDPSQREPGAPGAGKHSPRGRWQAPSEAGQAAGAL